MARSPAYKKWFSEAIYDLKIGKISYEWADRSLLRCGYQAHQCVEKALKGYLIYLKEQYPRSHDLGELAELVLKKDNSLKSTLADVGLLTPFYLAGRYPDAVINEEAIKDLPSKIESYFKLAQTILDELLQKIHELI